MSLLKTGACFTEELTLNCPAIVACVKALPVGAVGAPGTLVLGKDGQYHALPAAGVPQVLGFNEGTLSLSGGGGSVLIPDKDEQMLLINGNELTISGGNTVVLPTTAAPIPQVLSIAGNNVSLSGGGGTVALPAAAAQDPYATPAQTIAGTAAALIVNPADLYARENIAAQTGLGLDLSAIPAPTASQSNWGVNTLGETLHYAPGLGWQIVSKLFIYTQTLPVTVLPNGPIVSVHTFTVPRTGFCDTSLVGHFRANNGAMITRGVYLYVNGVFSPLLSTTQHETIPLTDSDVTSVAFLRVPVVAGDVLEFRANQLSSAGGVSNRLDRSMFVVGYAS